MKKGWDHPEAQYSKRGHTSFSVVVWTPEHNGDQGLEMARLHQGISGGHAFMSITKPGYVIWFDASWTPDEIMAHELTQGHTGIINPTAEQAANYSKGLTDRMADIVRRAVEANLIDCEDSFLINTADSYIRFLEELAIFCCAREKE